MRRLETNRLQCTALCLLLIPISLTLGCAASTELMSTWSEPGYADGTVDNVLVVALRDDPVKRRRWEDGFVASLKARGVEATPSYSLFPSALPDTQQVLEAVQKNGFGGVMSLMRLTDQSRTVTSPDTPGGKRSRGRIGGGASTPTIGGSGHRRFPLVRRRKPVGPAQVFRQAGIDDRLLDRL